MSALVLELRCDDVPEGRVPRAQRWGYAGRRRESVSDDEHPEMGNWAGYVDHWKTKVEASNSFRVLDTLTVREVVVTQDDV
jgi:hypothetical protein